MLQKVESLYYERDISNNGIAAQYVTDSKGVE